MFYLLRPIFFPNLSLFSGLCSPIIPRYFLDFASEYNHLQITQQECDLEMKIVQNSVSIFGMSGEFDQKMFYIREKLLHLCLQKL